MSKKFYITTPIYYPSAKLHIGHCYCTVVSDTIARYNRLIGNDVFFLTGTDEHGQKIQRKAEQAGKTPKQYVDEIVANTKQLWKTLEISYDRFIRTTDSDHVKCVQKIYEILYKQGDIYKSNYEGWYCTSCEAFFTEAQLKDGKCPDCGKDVEWLKEESYFFKLSKYQDRLKKFFEQNPDFLEPETRRNEMLSSFLNKGLKDLCVSRTTFNWGIPLTFDQKHIAYVWIDALANYISALGYLSDDDSLFKKYWPADIHMVGKEITRFHSIIWPALLMALNLPLPKKIFGHGWLLVGGDKISKSLGNYKDPRQYLKYSSVDALRYYLLKEITLGQDGNFDESVYIERINSDLSNNLGNLLNRTIAMTLKYNKGVLSRMDFEKVQNNESDNWILAELRKMIEGYKANMDNSRPDLALDLLMTFVSCGNKYIDLNEPWKLSKNQEDKPRLNKVLYILSETLRIVAILLKPYMVYTPDKIFKQLGIDKIKDITTFDSIDEFGKIPDNTVCQRGERIFPRIDAEKVFKQESQNDKKDLKEGNKMEKEENTQKLNNQQKNEAKKEEEKSQEEKQKNDKISIDDFAKVELRVAQIKEVEKVQNADKLYKLTIDLGAETRTIVSGIVPYYKEEELIGKKIVVVSNLKPAKLRGIMSNGMLLAAGDGDVVKLVTIDSDIENGTRIH